MKLKRFLIKLIVKNKQKLYPNSDYTKHHCCLVSYQTPLLKHCYILCHEHLSATGDEDQLIQFAQQEAQRLSKLHTQHSDHFVLVLGGKNVRKRENWHMHIFIIQNRYQKAYAYQVLALKNFSLAILELLNLKK